MHFWTNWNPFAKVIQSASIFLQPLSFLSPPSPHCSSPNLFPHRSPSLFHHISPLSPTSSPLLQSHYTRQWRQARDRERERVGEPSLHQLSEPPCSNIVMLMFCCLVNSFITNAAHIQQSFHPPSPLQPLCPPIIMTRPGTEKQSWLVHLHPFQIPPSWRNMNIEYVSQESRQSGRPHLRSAPLYTQ